MERMMKMMILTLSVSFFYSLFLYQIQPTYSVLVWSESVFECYVSLQGGKACDFVTFMFKIRNIVYNKHILLCHVADA